MARWLFSGCSRCCRKVSRAAAAPPLRFAMNSSAGELVKHHDTTFRAAKRSLAVMECG